MSFKDKEYANRIWTEDKIHLLEEGWEKQKKGWYNLVTLLLPRENDATLDVGCGIGMYYDLLSGISKKYTGVDPTNAMINRAKQRRPDGDWRIGSIYNLSFPNNSFDLVFCWSVLIHLPHDTIERALIELWRVTKKHLFLNLYVSLDCPSFSWEGPWGEYLTAMDKFWIRRVIRQLSSIEEVTELYEPTDRVDNKRFQRTIFRLKKGES